LFAVALAAQAFAGGFGVAAPSGSNDQPTSYLQHCAPDSSRTDGGSADHHRGRHNCLLCQGCCAGFSPITTEFVEAELAAFRAASRLAYGAAFSALAPSRASLAHRARAPPAIS
jgi:hypothetical protein